jgi:hypothetical protein
MDVSTIPAGIPKLVGVAEVVAITEGWSNDWQIPCGLG